MMREKPDPDKSYERLMLLLYNRGIHYEELATFKDAIYNAARFEDLVKDLESAIRVLDFNRIVSAQKALRAECKRQNWQATLTTLEERVIIIHAVLQQEKRRPPTVPEILEMLISRYQVRGATLRHDEKSIRRVCARLELVVSEGKRGPKPK